MSKLLGVMPNYVKVILVGIIVFLVLMWIKSLIEIRNEAIDLKDTAADTAYTTLEAELERSQAQVNELSKTIATKDVLINGLSETNGKLSALRGKLENELQTVRGQKSKIEAVLKRYELNYTKEAIRDVESVEGVTNITISDLMREYEAITSEATGSEAGDSRGH